MSFISIEQDIEIIREKKMEIYDIRQYRTSVGGQWMASVKARFINEQGKILEHFEKVYPESEYNRFWELYNNGAFVTQELYTGKGIETAIPVDIESHFTN